MTVKEIERRLKHIDAQLRNIPHITNRANRPVLQAERARLIAELEAAS